MTLPIFYSNDCSFYSQHTIITEILLLLAVFCTGLIIEKSITTFHAKSSKKKNKHTLKIEQKKAKKDDDSERLLVKIFYDKVCFRNNGITPDSIQVRLIKGEGGEWLHHFFRTHFDMSNHELVFEKLPLRTNNIKQDAWYYFGTSSNQPFGFALKNIPENSVRIIETKNMEAEKDLTKGIPVNVRSNVDIRKFNQV